jgi:hypothetical protein
MAANSAFRSRACRVSESVTDRELARGGLAGLEAVTAFNAPVFESHIAITATIRQALGTDAARTFARPVFEGDTIAWFTDAPGPIRAWADLSPAERDAREPLRRQLGESLDGLTDTLRRQGANTQQGNLSHLIETARVVPGPEHLFLVGDCPVLTYWGFRRVSDLGLDPFGTEQLTFPPAPLPPSSQRWPWLVLLAALALLGGGTWWWFSRVPPATPIVAPPHPPPPAPELPKPLSEPPKVEPAKPDTPKPEPPKPEPLPEPPKPETPKAELPAPPPAPPPPLPAPPVQSTPPADLPKQRWDQGDLSALDGCWSLGRAYSVMSYDMLNRPLERGTTRAARLCLDKAGHGQESSVSDFPSGQVNCTARVTANFDVPGHLSIHRPSVMCSPPRMHWVGAQLSCVRESDTVALCTESGEHGQNQLEFRRAR